MQQPATTSLPSNAPTFAGLLASLTAPLLKRPPLRDLDGLEDDVATLSYERALRTHARYRAPALPQRSPASDPAEENLRIYEVVPDNVETMVQPMFTEPFPIESEPIEPASGASVQIPRAQVRPDQVQPDRVQSDQAQPDQAPLPQIPPAQFEAATTSMPSDRNAAAFPRLSARNLKSASITIRLTSVEYAQLRQRSEEAGLSVSAYLRSCTFEAESLRAMVKDTVSKLKSDTSKESDELSEPRRSGPSWWSKLWQSKQTGRGAMLGL